MTQPIIIIGAARSGTKYLRDTLALGSNAAKVPYDINYIWRYGNEAYPDDALPAHLLDARKCAFVAAQVHRLAKVAPGDSQLLFEKTVGNTLRIGFVDAVFPNAKYIHLIRDGRAVTESAMRQWREPLDKGRLLEKLKGVPLRNLNYVAWFAANVVRGKLSGRGGGHVWGPRYPGIGEDVARERPLVEICAEQWRASVAAALDGLTHIAPERQITIRYDALVSGTDALAQVAEFCGLNDVETILSAHRERVDTRADNKWQSALGQSEKDRMLTIIDPLLAQLHYSAAGATA